MNIFAFLKMKYKKKCNMLTLFKSNVEIINSSLIQQLACIKETYPCKLYCQTGLLLQAKAPPGQENKSKSSIPRVRKNENTRFLTTQEESAKASVLIQFDYYLPYIPLNNSSFQRPPLSPPLTASRIVNLGSHFISRPIIYCCFILLQKIDLNYSEISDHSSFFIIAEQRPGLTIINIDHSLITIVNHILFALIRITNHSLIINLSIDTLTNYRTLYSMKGKPVVHQPQRIYSGFFGKMDHLQFGLDSGIAIIKEFFATVTDSNNQFDFSQRELVAHQQRRTYQGYSRTLGHLILIVDFSCIMAAASFSNNSSNLQEQVVHQQQKTYQDYSRTLGHLSLIEDFSYIRVDFGYIIMVGVSSANNSFSLQELVVRQQQKTYQDYSRTLDHQALFKNIITFKNIIVDLIMLSSSFSYSLELVVLRQRKIYLNLSGIQDHYAIIIIMGQIELFININFAYSQGLEVLRQRRIYLNCFRIQDHLEVSHSIANHYRPTYFLGQEHFYSEYISRLLHSSCLINQARIIKDNQAN